MRYNHKYRRAVMALNFLSDCEKHQGQIEVISQLGQGTEFAIAQLIRHHSEEAIRA